MNEIIKEFGNKVIKRKGEYYFNSEDAIAFVERCRVLGKKIIGIESFKIEGPTIQPMDYIDYSSKTYVDSEPTWYFEKYHIKKNNDIGHWEEAKQFIKDRANQGWIFEFSYK